MGFFNFDLFTISINIHETIHWFLVFFLPFLAENNELYPIYRTHPYFLFGLLKIYLIRTSVCVKTCSNCSRMNSSIIW